jgi:hypothetical protein
MMCDGLSGPRPPRSPTQSRSGPSRYADTGLAMAPEGLAQQGSKAEDTQPAPPSLHQQMSQILRHHVKRYHRAFLAKS